MMTPYGLATIRYDEQATACVQVDDRLWPLVKCGDLYGKNRLPNDLLSVFDDWNGYRDVIADIAVACAEKRFDPGIAVAVEKARFLAPIQTPRKILCVGANYSDHMKKIMDVLMEMGYTRPEASLDRPIFFMKPPTTSVVGPGPTVRSPAGSKQLDWEIELAAVIGHRISNANPVDAIAAVAGYTVALDMSVRDWQLIPRTLFGFDLFAGKAHDTGCPMGPVVVPADFVADPQDLPMRLAVNGEVKQDGSTSGMIYPVAEVVSFASRVLTLEPGDVVLTGTPAGTGVESNTFLAPGDEITATIDGIGTLEVSVRTD